MSRMSKHCMLKQCQVLCKKKQRLLQIIITSFVGTYVYYNKHIAYTKPNKQKMKQKNVQLIICSKYKISLAYEINKNWQKKETVSEVLSCCRWLITTSKWSGLLNSCLIVSVFSNLVCNGFIGHLASQLCAFFLAMASN